jgi:hypothetical protein
LGTWRHACRLAQIYEEAKYDLHDLLSLHRIVKVQGMEKQDIINVLDLVKNDQLQTLQLKAQHLIDEIDMVDTEKTEAMTHIFICQACEPAVSNMTDRLHNFFF